MKKFWLFILSLVAISFVGVSFADAIPDNSHYLERCSNLKNAGIDKYKVVYAYTYEDWPAGCWHGPVNLCSYEKVKLVWKVSEYDMETCLPVGDVKIYLLDGKENANLLTQDNIDKKAIYMGNVVVKKSGYVDNSNPLSNETISYKIVKDGKDYKMIKASVDSIERKFKCDNCIDAGEMSEDYKLFRDMLEIKAKNNGTDIVDDTSENVVENKDVDVVLRNDKVKDFGIAWILTVLIETFVLFDIVKLFFKKEQIQNLRIFLVGILASTITLPLLRFVLPLFIKGGMWYVVIGELLVTLIEVFIIKYGLKISRWKAILVSVVCNLCSYLIGLIIF